MNPPRRSGSGGPRILVLGSDGMVGRVLTRTFARDFGWDVMGTSRRPAAATRAPWPIVSFSMPDHEGDLGAMFRAFGAFDLIVNAIACLTARIDARDPGQVASATHTNAWFPNALARVLPQFPGTRLIHLSTDGVFAPTVGDVDENSPADADDWYGRSKRAGEPSAPGVLSVRASFVGLDPARGLGILEHARRLWSKGETCRGFFNQRWTGCTPLQLADLIAKLADEKIFRRVSAESSVLHFAPNPVASKFELVSIWSDVVGGGGAVERTEGPPLDRCLRNMPSVATALGPVITDTDWRGALTRLLRWEHRGQV